MLSSRRFMHIFGTNYRWLHEWILRMERAVWREIGNFITYFGDRQVDRRDWWWKPSVQRHVLMMVYSNRLHPGAAAIVSNVESLELEMTFSSSLCLTPHSAYFTVYVYTALRGNRVVACWNFSKLFWTDIKYPAWNAVSIKSAFRLLPSSCVGFVCLMRLCRWWTPYWERFHRTYWQLCWILVVESSRFRWKIMLGRCT